MINSKRTIEDLSTELTGITQSLFLLAKEFDNCDRPTTLSNDIISGTLYQIACHIERINDDLDERNKS